ncbi:hypothetical protein JXA80_08740, partial [bacterium]|nr:hypothetical protein [candidate division CSSED10-310 bacterium]
ILETAPVCSCGFVPEQKLPVTAPNIQLIRLRSRIRIALNMLQEWDARRIADPDDSRTPSACGGTSRASSGESAGDPIEALMALDPETPDIVPRLDAILDTRLLERLLMVDSGKSPRVVVRFSDLRSILEGQVLSLEQARRIVRSWLENAPGLDDGDWIKFDE